MFSDRNGVWELGRTVDIQSTANSKVKSKLQRQKYRFYSWLVMWTVVCYFIVTSKMEKSLLFIFKEVCPLVSQRVEGDCLLLWEAISFMAGHLAFPAFTWDTSNVALPSHDSPVVIIRKLTDISIYIPVGKNHLQQRTMAVKDSSVFICRHFCSVFCIEWVTDILYMSVITRYLCSYFAYYCSFLKFL